MLNIHPEVQDVGVSDEDENKENRKGFCIFCADQKSENTNHAANYVKRRMSRQK